MGSVFCFHIHNGSTECVFIRKHQSIQDSKIPCLSMADTCLEPLLSKMYSFGFGRAVVRGYWARCKERNKVLFVMGRMLPMTHIILKILVLLESHVLLERQ